MSFQIRKAERTRVCPKIAISGPSGSGKTLSALMIAFGITKDWSKILVIDTENNSSELYSNAEIKNLSKQIGQFDVIEFKPPFSPQRYCEAVLCAEQSKYQVVIIDSLSHSWNASGGALDMVNNSSEINSYAKWKHVTPAFNKMINSILQSSCTIICTLRAKQAYVMETNERGKQVPKKVGLEPIIRDGIEFEFTTVFEMSLDHYGMTSKDRSGMFSGQLVMDEGIGHAFEQWRLSGAPIRPIEQSQVQYAQNTFQPQPVNYQQPVNQAPVQQQYQQQMPPQVTQPQAPPQAPPVIDPALIAERSAAISEYSSLVEALNLKENIEQQKTFIRQATGLVGDISFKSLTSEQIKASSGLLKNILNQPAQQPEQSANPVLF